MVVDIQLSKNSSEIVKVDGVSEMRGTATSPTNDFFIELSYEGGGVKRLEFESSELANQALLKLKEAVDVARS